MEIVDFTRFYGMETGCQDSHPWKIEQEKLVRQQQFTVA